MKTTVRTIVLAAFASGLLLGALGSATAGPPFPIPPKGGLPACKAELLACETELTACDEELAACEDKLDLVFPGDGWLEDAYPSGGVPLSYTENGDGTFTDNNTKLVWEMKLASTDPTCANPDQANRDVHCANNTYTWTETLGGSEPDGTAFDFINYLNRIGFGGHADWRLPTIKELQSLLDYTTWGSTSDPYPYRGPYVSSELPGATAVDFYWSSTTVAAIGKGAKSAAWYLGFGVRNVSVYDSKSVALRVRAVSGGQ